MDLTRRDALRISAAAIAITAIPVSALAESNGYEEIVAAFTGGADAADGGVTIDAPEIAENGNTVPVSIAADGAESIILISTGNPNPKVATFNFGALAASSSAATRIRLAKTQDLLAVARMKDGSFRKGTVAVKVTIGGCGG